MLHLHGEPRYLALADQVDLSLDGLIAVVRQAGVPASVCLQKRKVKFRPTNGIEEKRSK